MRAFFFLLFFLTLIFFNHSQSYSNQAAYSKSLLRAEDCEFFSFEARVDENKKLSYSLRKTSGSFLPIFPEDKKELSKCLYEKSDLNKKCEAIKFAIGFYPKSLNTSLSLLEKVNNDHWARNKAKYLRLYLDFQSLGSIQLNKKKFRDICSMTDDGLSAYLISLEFSKINDIENRDFCLMSAKRLNFHTTDTKKAKDIYNIGLASKNAQFLKESWSSPACHSNKGLLYQYGIGETKDLLFAEKLYLEGTYYNSANAYKNLALLYEENPIFGKSKNEINSLYIVAAERGDVYSRLILRSQKK
jgi:hypothetical protein